MAGDAPALQPESWLYTREDESVRVEAHEDGGVWAASITGPGTENRLRLFRDRSTFETFRAEHDRELVSRGFRLRVLAERRAGNQKSRVHPPRPATDDRRRR